MRIQDLEEWQGVTAEMVRAYLERTGWTLGPAERDGDYLPPGQFWTKGAASVWDAAVLERLETIAGAEHRTPQAILREICPRMRKGIPSEADRAAHPLAWVGVSGNGRNIMVGMWVGARFRRGNAEAVHPAEWSFWPIDLQGAKVPWPTPARGSEGG